MGDRQLGEGCDRGRSRRPRRPDGLGRLGDHRRRRAAAEARLQGTDPVDDRAHRQGRRRGRRPAGHLGLVRAGRSRRADGRRDHARREARPAVHGLPRRRVRHRWALHGRAGETRRSRHRRRRRARPGRRGTGGARALRRRRPRGRRGSLRRATVRYRPGEWISASRDGLRSSAAPRPGSGSHRQRHSPKRAQTSRCSPAAASSSSSRPTGSARSLSAAT